MFLHRFTEKRGLDEPAVPVDSDEYSTAPARLCSSGRRDYMNRTRIERWFRIFDVRTDRVQRSWVGSRRGGREWCRQFRRHYNRHRPSQALDGTSFVELIETVPVRRVARFQYSSPGRIRTAVLGYLRNTPHECCSSAKCTPPKAQMIGHYTTGLQYHVPVGASYEFRDSAMPRRTDAGTVSGSAGP